MTVQLAYEPGSVNVKAIIPRPFNGKLDGSGPTYPEWKNSWYKVHRLMKKKGADDVELYHELNKTVSGAVKVSIAHLDPEIPASYLLATTSIEDRYGELQHCLADAWQRWIDIPKMVHLKADTVETVRASMNAYLTSVKQIDKYLEVYFFYDVYQKVLKKMCPEVRKDWEDYIKTKKNNANPLGYDIKFEDLEIVLSAAASTYRRMERDGLGKKDNKGQKGGGKGGGGDDPTFVGALASGQSGPHQVDGNKIKFQCPFCAKGPGMQEYKHQYPRSCPYLKPDMKKDLNWLRSKVRGAKACRNCYAPEHDTAACPAKKDMVCGQDGCRQRHGSLFHGQNDADGQGRGTKNPKNSGQGGGGNQGGNRPPGQQNQNPQPQTQNQNPGGNQSSGRGRGGGGRGKGRGGGTAGRGGGRGGGNSNPGDPQSQYSGGPPPGAPFFTFPTHRNDGFHGAATPAAPGTQALTGPGGAAPAGAGVDAQSLAAALLAFAQQTQQNQG